MSNKQSKKAALPKVVLVTGCGSGLGLALARQLYHENRHRVVVTARTKESVEFLRAELPEGVNFQVHQLDITDREQRESLIAKVYKNWKSIDVLVNNAGISYRSVIEHMDDESEASQLDVNYLSPMALIRLVVPGMRERGLGQIINVSSVSGMMAMPTMASYSASKHALEGATEALWYELKPFGISVTLVQPGFIKSQSFEKVYFSRKAELSRDVLGPYSDFYENMGPFIERKMLRSRTTPEKISKKILNLIEASNPPLWCPVTPDATAFFWIRKILPRRIFHKVMFWLLPKANKWGEKQKQRNKRYFFSTTR